MVQMDGNIQWGDFGLCGDTHHCVLNNSVSNKRSRLKENPLRRDLFIS